MEEESLKVGLFMKNEYLSHKSQESYKIIHQVHDKYHVWGLLVSLFMKWLCCILLNVNEI